jgi:predicted nuclease of predicted toxin-antitoxin system
MPVPVKVDEDLPIEVSRLVGAAGHDSKTACEQGYNGLPDDQLWSKIQEEQRMLFTADKGFANARSYPPGSHAGVVLFRLSRESRAGYIRLAEFLLNHLKLENVAGAIVVVSPDAIRVLRAQSRDSYE